MFIAKVEKGFHKQSGFKKRDGGWSFGMLKKCVYYQKRGHRISKDIHTGGIRSFSPDSLTRRCSPTKVYHGTKKSTTINRIWCLEKISSVTVFSPPFSSSWLQSKAFPRRGEVKKPKVKHFYTPSSSKQHHVIWNKFFVVKKQQAKLSWECLIINNIGKRGSKSFPIYLFRIFFAFFHKKTCFEQAS